MDLIAGEHCFDVIIEHDEAHGLWVTYVPGLNNISTYGDTREEALAYTREAIEGYLIVSARRGLPLPAPRPQDLALLAELIAIREEELAGEGAS